ncbi:UDP-N-acetylmuramate--L-alanine ligase [Alkalicella caledoniensis]|uniref:UDP-N-acetylmuramate--L-alanine ligase n=1 Tax=Alkalicella caledoniensis TaxID=2731377 RepID=A0A7G9W782_ALKCA|nr:UDP-N-acetylmuramate--L-alanine ligase [Alkalicella caledoniensis]QNO14544.1 UDP-N-acetylmuramate--L-alanine ligase [Alkalicella caledoniensis]
MEGINKFHLIGIGGYGMSAIAKILLEKGYQVSGSDLNKSSIVERLINKGAKIYLGHSKENIQDTEAIIYSTAIPDSNPELAEARAKGLKIYHRSEMLAVLLNQGYGIAIAGAHGKTTTTSMTSLILEQGGKDPTALIGGELSNFEGNARLGKSNIVVAEACESDHSFLRYNPDIALITNIEADHLEHYDGSFEKLLDTYHDFLKNLEEDGSAVVYYDDENIKEVLNRGFDKNLVTYGLADTNMYYPKNIVLKEMGSTFDLYKEGKLLGQIELAVPGEHNILNALGATVVGLLNGVDIEDVNKALKSFVGAKRRFQVIHNNEVLVVDDYAHHPTEIKATLKAAKKVGMGRVIAIFQPQRYTRTKFFIEEFAQSFDDAQKAILADIYTAGEEPIEGVTSKILVEKIKAYGHKEAIYMGPQEDILDYLKKEVQPNDLVITMGAGDIYKVAYELGQWLEQQA